MTEENRPHPFMPTRAEGKDPNICHTPGCGQVWNSITHQPSRYLAALEPYRAAVSEALRTASEEAGVPRELLAAERASGAPREAAPATHTGRPAQHSGRPTGPDLFAPAIRCPVATTCNQLRFPAAGSYAQHLADVHNTQGDTLKAYLRELWMEGESRESWKLRTFHLRYGMSDGKLTAVFGDPIDPAMAQGALDKLEVVTEPEFCQHPNGFGPNGCPCGKGQPGEDDPDTVRNIDTGEDVPATRCPECREAFPNDQILTHMREVEASDQEDIDEMAEMLGIPTLVPPDLMQTLEKNMADDNKRREQVEAFLNADVPTEQLVVAGPGTKLDPRDLEAALTAWWMNKASEETSAVVPKAVEYGATDLRDIGRDLADCMGRVVTDEEATELGIFFYLRGKLSRWVDAVKRGDRPSDDTIYDIGVYCRMAQRNRDVGGWPGLPVD
jgi:hypothetical protein